jgi:hypothetical protein
MLRRFFVSLAIGAASVGTLSIDATYAASPTPASGTSDVTFAITGSRSADSSGNTILQFSAVAKLSGTLSGTRIASGRLIVHPDGTLNAVDSGVFTGTVHGSSPGTLVMNEEASGTFAGLTGRYDAGMGTGGLSGVHSQGGISGAAVGPTELIGTYLGMVEFSGS